MLDTSLEAFAALDLNRAEALKDAIMREAYKWPGTSAEIARRLKVSEYAVSKRTSDLIQEGRLMRGGVSKNPSGRLGHILHPTWRGSSMPQEAKKLFCRVHWGAWQANGTLECVVCGKALEAAV